MDILKLIPSKENVADLLKELNQEEMCIMCEKSKATMANNSLCSYCWAECEGENSDDDE